MTKSSESDVKGQERICLRELAVTAPLADASLLLRFCIYAVAAPKGSWQPILGGEAWTSAVAGQTRRSSWAFSLKILRGCWREVKVPGKWKGREEEQDKRWEWKIYTLVPSYS